jgi:hypothetical protein
MIKNKSISSSDSSLESCSIALMLSDDDLLEEFTVNSITQKGFRHLNDAIEFLEQVKNIYKN